MGRVQFWIVTLLLCGPLGITVDTEIANFTAVVLSVSGFLQLLLVVVPLWRRGELLRPRFGLPARGTAAAVRAPLALFYYYADPQHEDTVVRVSAMRDFFAKTNGGHPHPLSRQVAIADGNHILLSQYVRTDKKTILEESRRFLQEALMRR